jgi:hypothetical protein
MQHFEKSVTRPCIPGMAMAIRRSRMLASIDVDGKTVSDCPNVLSSLYSNLKSAFLAGHTARLDESLTSLASYSEQFSFELDPVFVDLSIQSILLEIATTGPPSFSLPLVDASLSIIQELTYTRSNGFVDFFVESGFLPPLVSILASTAEGCITKRVLNILIHIAYHSVAFAQALCPLLSIPHLIDQIRLSFCPMADAQSNALPPSISLCLRLSAELLWLDALNYFLQCKLFRDVSRRSSFFWRAASAPASPRR